VTDEKIERLKRVLERGIGAEIAVRVDKGGLRTGLRAHFAELGAHGGPICTIRPSGLRRHLVNLRFGDYAGPCIRQIQNADYERQATARGLLKGIAISHELKFRPEQAVESWVVRDGSFNVEVVVRDVADYDSADSVAHTATEVMVPMLAAMAELIGYGESEAGEIAICAFRSTAIGVLRAVSIL
jgi:5-methylcytosine-specific restriction protein A